MRKALLLFFGSILVFLAVPSVKNILAVDDPCLSKKGQDKVDCYNGVLSQLGSQAKTLANQIAQFNAQINLTASKITQTEEQITLLGGRIDQLETSLGSLSDAFSERAVATYKMSRSNEPVFLLLNANNLGDIISSFHYLERIQDADRNLMMRLQKAQNIYKDQKVEQEDLARQLADQKALLAKQKNEKAALLAVTKNSESVFTSLRDEALAELAVVSGLGKETYLRDVAQGEVIGNVITSTSGCSSGRHLHFEIHQGNSVADPNNFLSSTSFSYSYPPNQYSYFGTINPHGSWPWPMNSPIQINQGFGATGYGRDVGYPNGVHAGIDMDSDSSTTVKAVHQGKLYGGSYQCGGKFPGVLSYAKIDNGDGTTAWYLHMFPH